MKIIIITSPLFCSPLVNANAENTSTQSPYQSYSDVEVGVEMIDYQESLPDLAGIISV
ncbi:hypothetical protein [Colwellia piezophila]|uniref:hypothetical protein n=1 Tax=Colwellia piezophila TaxID=211668 RepID=UPI0003792275|nr:hypothetical protein [Colwellia piezophila]